MATLTTRLGRLFSRTKARKPVAIDVFSATRHADRNLGHHANSDRAADSLREMIDPPAASSHDHAEPRKGLIARLTDQRPAAKRDAAIAQLKQGYDEVVDLMRTVREHLNCQSERSAKLMEIMRHVPEALQSLPESNRNQARLLEVVQGQLDQQNRHAARFNESLAVLTRVTEQQMQIMGVVQQHMDAAGQTDEKLLGSFSAMNQTLEGLNDSTRASSATLRDMSERANASDRRMEQLVQRTTRQMTVISITSWVLAAIALGTAVYAVLSLR